MRRWEVEVEVRCLRRPVHSGRGGGALPDPIQAICRLLARLPGGGLRVVRLDAPSVVGSINQITDVVRTRVRLPALPGGRGREAARRIADRLRTRPPFGAAVSVRVASTPGRE
jgi:hypothetical protein